MNDKKYFWGIVHSILCSILFGLSFLFTKQVTDKNSVLTLLGWRFLVAALVLTILVVLKVLKVDFRKKDIVKLMKLIFLYPIIYFISETIGVTRTTSSEAGVIISVIPLATILASFLILKEKPFRSQMIGIIISTAGIFISIFASSVDATFDLLGYLMLFIAVTSYSLYAVYVVRAPEFSILEKTYFMMILGAIIFFGAALVEHYQLGTLSNFLTLPITDTKFLSALGYLSIGSSIIAFFSSNYALEALGANRSVSFSGLSTVISILAGVVVLKEPFGPLKILASILIVGGVYIANAKSMLSNNK